MRRHRKVGGCFSRAFGSYLASGGGPDQKRSEQERRAITIGKMVNETETPLTCRGLIEWSVQLLCTAAEWTLLFFSNFNADAFHPFLIFIIQLSSVYHRFIVFPVLDHEQKLASVVALGHEIIISVVSPKKIA